MARELRRTYTGPIIDIHTHPRLPGAPVLQVAGDMERYSTEDYLRRARAYDIRNLAGLVIAPRSDMGRTRRLNDQILDWAKDSRGRFLPFGSVHPSDGGRAVAEVDRIARRGARGLKLHPNTQQFDVADPGVKSVARRAAKNQLPVLFDAYSPFDANQVGKFVRLAMEVPEGRFILAHAHGPRFPDLLVYEVLSRYTWWKRNVWIDLSGIAPLLAGGPFTEQFVWVLRKVGIDRVLFGSDYPLEDPATAISAIARMGFTAGELGRIFSKNARELFNL